MSPLLSNRDKEIQVVMMLPLPRPRPPKLSDYDALRVQEIWENSIYLDVDLGNDDPFYAQSNSMYNASIKQADRLIFMANKAKTTWS